VNFAWIISLFFIFLYLFYLKKNSQKRYFFLFLAPLSFGLGIVVPLYEVLLSLENYRKNLLSILLSLICILISYILPYLNVGQPANIDPHLSVNLLTSIYTLLGNLASLFVLCHKSLSPISFFVGAIQFTLVAIYFFLIYYKKNKNPFFFFIRKNPMLIMGLLFSILISIKRSQIESMVASRYATGNVLFQIGFIYLIRENFHKKIFDLYTKGILTYFFISWLLPYQAIHWQALKSYRSDLIQTCYNKAHNDFKKCNSLTYEITFYNSEIWMTKEEFAKLIDNLMDRKIIFFNKLPKNVGQ